MHTSVMSGKKIHVNSFRKETKSKNVEKGSSGMERESETHVVSDQDLHCLHRSMSMSF